MSANNTNPFLQTICLGMLAGMRTFSAPAIATHILSNNKSKALNRTPLAFMQSGVAATVFKVLAVGELIGDKNPSAPNRTSPAGLIGRSLAGALAGAAICKAAGHKGIRGALLGGITAAASTYISFEIRKEIVELTGYADPYIGVSEDLLVIAGAAALITQS